MLGHVLRATLLVLLTLVLVAAATAGGGSGFEVWAVDQSNTTGTTSGGSIHVYDGSSLEGAAAAKAEAERIDLGGATQALCLAQTGSAPTRPHMVFFNTGQSHAVLSFVSSGHVVFFDAASRTPLTCIDVGVQAHAAIPAPDESYVVVANQNGKLLQRIRTDYATNTFALDAAATLDLASGTTPSGAPKQDPAVRPDNAPICPLVDSSSRLSFVTLRGGGLFVVDSRATPMRIVAEYDKATVHGNGCGGAETAGKMYLDSGGGTAANLNEFDVYSFALAAFGSGGPFAPNTPAPTLVVSQDDHGHVDAHGTALTKHGRYLWVIDRAGNRIVVIDTATDDVVNELALAGELSDDPSPDLPALSPQGNRMFLTLRGSIPLTGDPHVSTGSTPGVGVIRVEQGGRDGTLQAIARISNVDAAGVDRGDPHGIAVRRR